MAAPRRLDRAFTGPTSTRRRRANALPGELGVLADAEDASELARQAAEGADALAGATERVNGGEQIVLSVLTTLAFALLFVFLFICTHIEFIFHIRIYMLKPKRKLEMTR